MRVVAVLNQKGGVGKTTTAVNLGAALALRENEVLLIDLDPQGNLTDHLGLDPEALDGEADRPSAYDVLMGEAALRDAVLATGTPHLAVLPSHQDLAAVELELAGVPGRELRLKEALAKLPPKAYDWVLIDCPPSLGLLSLNAMAAANEVFITLQTEYFALRGLGQLDKIVSLVREQVNPRLVISGIVATLVDPVTNLAREVVEEVKSVYGHRVFATRIRKNVRLAEAPGHQSHIFAYAPTSTGAADYHALADEVEAWDPTAGTTPPAVARKPAVPVAIPVEEPTRRQNGPKEKAAAKPPLAPSGAAAPRPKEAPKAKPPAPTKEATKAPVPETGKPAPRATTPVAAGPIAAGPIAAGPIAAAKAAPAAAPTPPRTAGGTFAPRNPPPPAKSAEPVAKPSAPPRSTPAPAPPAPKPAAPAAKPVASATSAVSPPTRPPAPVPADKPSAKGPGNEVRTPAVPEPKAAERKQAEAKAAEPKGPAPKAAEVKAGASRTTAAPAPAAPAKSAPAAPARPAVPSPALRNPRPWMKPAGK